MLKTKGKFIRMLIVVVVMTALAPSSSYAAAQHNTPSPDTRQRLVLPVAERDKVLAEMRVMLGSVSRILQAVASNDIAAVEEAARASGIAMAADVDPQIKRQLPQPFLTLGMQTHKGFDELADQVKAGGRREDVLRSLASLTGNCVACHAIYRIDEKP